MDFPAFPKIPRLRRDITITEKIDGTNGLVCITPFDPVDYDDPTVTCFTDNYTIRVGSRKRWITPGKSTDNYGFALWVSDNCGSLAEDLGEGTHYGEWWGQGIGRGYGLITRRFSLFNTRRWAAAEFETQGLDIVPTLYHGPWRNDAVDVALDDLDSFGSAAVWDYARPEGVVVFHHASGHLFKVLLEGDELPKGVTTAREREVAAELVPA